MKKEKIHIEPGRIIPHLPEEGRKKIKTGGPMKSKKVYDRKNNKKEEREEHDSSHFF
jgi:hypothetical protein